jgi:hypothetical protein
MKLEGRKVLNWKKGRKRNKELDESFRRFDLAFLAVSRFSCSTFFTD